MSKSPLFLNLLKIRLPITAKASITHRISAVGVFFLIFPFMGALLIATSSPEGFLFIENLGSLFLIKILLNLFVAGLTYHYIAGIRHLIMDFGYWETLKAGSISAYGVFILSGILIIYFSTFIW
ncbi:MAG: succinate dehydrogenase, cytochrome b556 subunit [Pseudomonadota bacterium]|nr:succinate dehydrogenase, cytochrome b556 subunit [Pseudomonadota bacterium]